jgi:hypothetical protein
MWLLFHEAASITKIINVMSHDKPRDTLEESVVTDSKIRTHGHRKIPDMTLRQGVSLRLGFAASAFSSETRDASLRCYCCAPPQLSVFQKYIAWYHTRILMLSLQLCAYDTRTHRPTTRILISQFNVHNTTHTGVRWAMKFPRRCGHSRSGSDLKDGNTMLIRTTRRCVQVTKLKQGLKKEYVKAAHFLLHV